MKLGGRELCQSIARLWFAYITEFRTSICSGLAAIDDSKLGVWGKTPKTWVWGEVRGSRVVPIDSPPMVCLYVNVSSFYLAPFPSYFDGSFRDTQTHTRHYTLALTRFLLRKSSRLKMENFF